MENYEEIYTKLTLELKELEKNLVETRKRYDEAVKNYGEAKAVAIELDEEVYDLCQERDRLPYSKHFRISVIVGIIALLTLMISALLYFQFTLQLSVWLTQLLTLTELQYAFLSCVIGYGGLVLISAIEVVLFKKIQKTLEKKSYNKIINSDQYKGLLRKIEVSEKDLDKVLNVEVVKRVRMDNAKAEYEGKLADISMRRLLINYIESQMNPKAEENSKSNARRRVKDNKNNGNIE